MILVLLIALYGDTSAEYQIAYTEQGVSYKLALSCIACDPDSPVTVTYSIANAGSATIFLHFPDSGDTDITIITPDSTFSSGDGRTFPVSRVEALDPGDHFSVTAEVPGSPSDRDTVTVIAQTAASWLGFPSGITDFENFLAFSESFGRQPEDLQFDARFDTDDGGMIVYADYLNLASTNWTIGSAIPRGATLRTQIVFRERTVDLNADSRIGLDDFRTFTGHYGYDLKSPNYDSAADLDGDGQIGFSDFLIYSSFFAAGH